MPLPHEQQLGFLAMQGPWLSEPASRRGVCSCIKISRSEGPITSAICSNL